MRVHRSCAALVTLAALATTAGAAACGGSGYQFVENDDLGVYAKIPDDWTVYDEEALFPDDSTREREQRLEGTWTRRFDAAADATVEHSKQWAVDEPTGTVRAFALSASMREQVSLSALRGLGVGDPTLDPLVVSEQDPSVQVVSDEPVEFEGGYHGVRTVFTVDPSASAAAQGQPAADQPRFVVDQTAILNSTSSTVYVFQIACNEQCYFETHKDAIADIVDSWTIQEVNS